MTATTTLTAPTVRRDRTVKPVWVTGAAAGLVASAATVGLAMLARAVDVPLTVGGEAIPLVGFAQLTFVASIIGTMLAVVMSHRASRRPRHTFVTTTIVLTALSIVPDMLADAQTATRVALALTHVVAAAIVIPALATRLTD